jgi:hypothetical protein
MTGLIEKEGWRVKLYRKSKQADESQVRENQA